MDFSGVSSLFISQVGSAMVGDPQYLHRGVHAHARCECRQHLSSKEYTSSEHSSEGSGVGGHGLPHRHHSFKLTFEGVF